MKETINVYIGNEHNYTIKRLNAQCFKIYIHNRHTTDEYLIAEVKSLDEAGEIIHERLKSNRAYGNASNSSKKRLRDRGRK